MLNQLIESKNHHAENARKNSFLLTTLGVLVAVLLSGWTYSLFAKNFGMGTGDFELSSLVAPIAPTEAEPPKPEPEERKPEREQTANNDESLMVKEKIARMEDSLNKPPKIEDARQLNSTPLKPSDWDKYAEGPENKYRPSSEGTENGSGLNQTNTSKTDDEGANKAPDVVVKPKPAATVENKPDSRPKSGGVLNGIATNLVKPIYPPTARAIGITGAVNVQVTIDENGNVISAVAASGHPLLRAVAVNAARQSKFTPTFLSGKPVKVTGVIIYQFKP